nr:unnamed protein product [Digitaria exilis]
MAYGDSLMSCLEQAIRLHKGKGSNLHRRLCQDAITKTSLFGDLFVRIHELGAERDKQALTGSAGCSPVAEVRLQQERTALGKIQTQTQL